MKASIIIATYNRAEILKNCLVALEKQNFKDFEVIVVDDGGSDNTREVISGFKQLSIKYIYQEHSQQGVARNKGIKIAKGGYIFFIGDDIIPKENWLEEHIKTLENNLNCGVLGLTLWHHQLKVNDFMNYLAPNGPQFNYGNIKNPKDCGWDFFWTSNISLPARFLKKENFDESFRGWGYEDLELGYRLEKIGLKIIFNKEAIAYHNHSYEDPEAFLMKQEDAAKNVVYMVKKHPELNNLIETNKLKTSYSLLLRVYSILPWIKRIKPLNKIYWKLKKRYYFEKGLKNENENNSN